MSLSTYFVNKVVSTLPLIKSFEIRKVESLSYQALGAYFKLYKVFSSLKIKSEYAGLTNPRSYSTYTSSSINLFKKALFTSI